MIVFGLYQAHSAPCKPGGEACGDNVLDKTVCLYVL